MHMRSLPRVLLSEPLETIGSASDFFASVGEHTRQLYRKKSAVRGPSIRELSLNKSRTFNSWPMSRLKNSLCCLEMWWASMVHVRTDPR